ILIRDGVITATNVADAPYDARVIELDSMYVYPGFIAAASHAGITKPKEGDRPEVASPGSPPNDVAGITPEKPLSESYSISEGSIEAMRKQGFTISHSMPYGRMLPGQTAIISLSGKDYPEVVLKDNHATWLQMKGSRGMFPSTEIGVMARWRDLVNNAKIQSSYEQTYAARPQNRKRPKPTPAVDALKLASAGKAPVYQLAEKHTHVSRAIRLSQELGYHLVIAEARRPDMSIDQIKSSGTTVLATLDLPEEVSIEQDSTAEEDKTWKDIEREEMMQKKKVSVDNHVAAASALALAGIPVSFSYLEAKPKDIHPAVRRMIAGGLSEEDALAALTTVPAKTLGIDGVAGTIANGKMANIVVMTGPIFDEKSKIKMVIIDGQIFEYETKEKKKTNGEAPAVAIEGDYTFVIEVPGLEPSGTVNITKNDDNTYNLTLTNSAVPGKEILVEGVELDGDNMTYSYQVNVQGMNATIDTDVNYDESSFEGTVDVGSFGTYAIKGERVSTPQQ
ncbi:MAG: amidohydrolase family protein, partial [Bacteroidota bacterium]